MNTKVKQLLFYIGFIAVWQLLYGMGIWPPSAFPSPLQVLQTLWARTLDLTLLQDLLASFKHLFIGYGIALVLGTLLGVTLAKWKTADQTLGNLILALQSVPSIAWLPLAIIWFGLSETAVIFIVVLGGTFVMTINMRIGIKNVPPLYLRAAKTMGSEGMDLFWKVIIPASIPHAVTGMRLAWAFGWRALMAGEILSTGPGLGYTLKYASDFGDSALVVGIIIIIGVIGTIADQIVFKRMESKVLSRWGLES
ncbi:ABC transporter permease [Bacillus tianshenii]|nr:ABC transporter permease [Bacillus tianshenii]